MLQEKQRWLFDNLEVKMKSLFSLVSCVFGFIASAFSGRSFQMRKQMVVAVVFGIFGGVCIAQDQSVVLDVPYIHQVRDVGVDGRNMCVSTSATMLVDYYGLQPVNSSSYTGWYVYNGYGDFVDFFGENYSTRLAGDWDRLNYVAGAHGYIAIESDGSWIGSLGRLRIFLENHGLVIDTPLNMFATIQREIGAGRPVLARFPIGANGGHYVLVTGVAGPNLVVVNDPNGNRYQSGWGTEESNGKSVVYNITDPRTRFSWIVTARPKARGWYPDDPLMVNDSSNRGHAVTPRYSWNGLERQDYQFLYRTSDSQGSVYERSYTQGIGLGDTSRGWDPAVSPAIVHAYNSYGRAGNVGYPTTLVTHSLNGQSWGSVWVHVLSGGALGECAFIYDPDNQDRKAFPLQNKFWQWYWDHQGPNYIMPNGFPLGSPTSNETYWKPDAPLCFNGPQAKQEFENGYLYWDTANVFIMEYLSRDSFHIAGANGSMPLVSSIWSLSDSQAYIDNVDGIDLGDDGWYAIFQDGIQMVATRLRDATINNLTPGSTHTYWVAIVDSAHGVLEQSSAITLTLAPPADFYINVTPTSENSVLIETINNRFPYAYAYAIYRNGMEIARTSGTEYSDILLNYNTSYTYKIAALTASNLVLGWTDEVTITTLSLPQNPPPPPPVQNPSMPLVIGKISIVEAPPYIVNGFANVFFIAYNPTPNIIYVKRFQIIGEFYDSYDGHVYARNWKAIDFDPPLAMNPYETYRYQNRNDGWPFPGYPLPGIIKAYAVIQGVVGQYQITQALPDESATFEFNVVYPPPLVRQSNHVPSMEVLTPNSTNNDEVVIKATDSNNDELASPRTEMTLSIDGIVVRTFDVPELAGYANFSIGANIGRLSAGIHILRLTADSTFDIGESREDDNVIELSLTVISVPKPNSVITEAGYQPHIVYAGRTVGLYFSVSNMGSAPMPAQRVGISYGQNIWMSDAPELNPGQSYGNEISIPSLITWRDVVFNIVSDFDNVADEEDELDNVRTLSVSFLAPVGDLWDPNDNLSSGATQLNNPTATEQTHGPHSLSGTDSYDWFKVSLTAGRNYNFNSIGGTGDDYAELYSNASGTVRVAYNDDSGGNNQFSFAYAPGATGWYYLRVRAYSVGNACSYSLKYRDAGAVTPPPVNDAWDPRDNTIGGATTVANPTATEQAHGTHTLSGTDFYDYFRVYLASGRNYNFNTIGGTGDNYGELYQAGTLRAYNDDSGGGYQFSLTYKPTSSGWCYIRVRQYSSGANCRYSLKYRDLGL